MAPGSASADSTSRQVCWTVSADEENVRVDQAVAARLEQASRTQAKRWVEQGRVRVQGKTVRPSRLLRAGEEVAVDLPAPEPSEPTPEAIPLDILFEDEDILVLNKPPRLVVHPAPGHPSGTLVNALLHHCRDLSGIGGVARPGIVHRLDQGTSGVMVVAKNDLAHRDLARQFAGRSVEKHYLALVYGRAPRRLRLEAPIGRDPIHRKKISSRSRQARPAVTEAERLEALPATTLLSIRLETGRTHQIRVHLSEAGFPLVGDKEYGRSRRPRKGQEAAFHLLERMARPALHAAVLAFRHPRHGKRMRLEALLPRDLRELIDGLRRLAQQDVQ
ncbi:MAG: RluA family pseudouridine synthase [Acidobacteriota bacterium]